ncbi:MAG: hypothetical protein WC958_03725 [Dehalococcoidales bacterium]
MSTTFRVIIGILLKIASLVGEMIQPFVTYKTWISNNYTKFLSIYDTDILSGQSASCNRWFITLDGGGWKGGTLSVKL